MQLFGEPHVACSLVHRIAANQCQSPNFRLRSAVARVTTTTTVLGVPVKIRIHALGLGLLLSATIVAGSAGNDAAAATSSGPAGPAANVTAERLLKAAAEPGQWMTYGGTYQEQRFSKLASINRDNVKQLGLAWFADYDTNLTQAGTPLFIDGVIYVSTAWSKVYAFDAKTGKQLWEYNPRVPGEWAVKVCCGLVNRGLRRSTARSTSARWMRGSSPWMRGPARKSGRPHADHRPEPALLDHHGAPRGQG